MIMGVSHIVLGSTDLTRDRALLESIGWKTQFEQRGIPTHPGKPPFMHTASATQGLVFMHPPQGTPVELIHYADELHDTTPTPLQIVLPQPKNQTRLDAFTCALQFDPAAPVPSLITHFVTDMNAARQFWQQGMGFKPSVSAITKAETDDVLLEFHSPLSQWRVQLLLRQHSGEETPGLVDGPGYRCLSFVSSNLARDRESVIRHGGTRSTGSMDLTIADKPLRMELFQAPDGVMIELLESRQQGNRSI